MSAATTRKALIQALTQYALRIQRPECVGDTHALIDALDAHESAIRDALLDALDADVAGMRLPTLSNVAPESALIRQGFNEAIPHFSAAIRARKEARCITRYWWS